MCLEAFPPARRENLASLKLWTLSSCKSVFYCLTSVVSDFFCCDVMTVIRSFLFMAACMDEITENLH